jgi:glycosyltransferase involved in cell wall biosynthesis
MAEPKVLAVLPYVPLPATSGGRLRTLGLLRQLDAALPVTTLALNRRPGAATRALAQTLRESLRGPLEVAESPRLPSVLAGEASDVLFGRPLRYSPYRRGPLARALEALLRRERFDIVHFDHLHTAQLAPVVRRVSPGTTVVVDAHNVESMVAWRMSSANGSRFRKVVAKAQAKRIEWLERDVLGQADLVLTCSSTDAGESARLGARETLVVPNGISLDTAALEEAPRTDVVFVASCDWWPNADAARRLVLEIWPRCEKALKGSRLALVGRASDKLGLLATPTIQLLGEVPGVEPHLARAWATAVPLRAGSGTRIKIIEAWAAGVPVVASKVAAEGLPLVDGENGLFAESAEEFAAALVRIHENPLLASRLRKEGLRTARAFQYPEIGAALVRRYRALFPAAVSQSV